MIRVERRSEGSYLLARTGKTQDELARALGVSQQIVAFWLSGKRLPSLPNRKQLLAKYKIPIEAWDKPHAPAAKPRTKLSRPEPESWGDGAVTARIERLQTIVDRGLEDLDRDDMAPMEHARVAGELCKVVGQLRRLRGEEVSELQILKHPKWQEVKTIVLDELADDPETLQRIVDRLKTAGA